MTFGSLTFSSIAEAWGETHALPSSKKSKKCKKDPLCSLYQQSQAASKELDEDFLNYLDDDEIVRTQKRDNNGRNSKYNVRPSREGDAKTLDNYEEVSLKDSIPHNVKRNRFNGACKYNDDDDAPEPKVLGTYNDLDADQYFQYSSMGKDDYKALCSKTAVFSEEDYHPAACPSPRSGGDSCVNKRSNIVYAEEDGTVERAYNVTRDRGGILEQYENNPSYMEKPFNSKQSFMDLFLYIVSGILLILMMEQILQLGMKLKK